MTRVDALGNEFEVDNSFVDEAENFFHPDVIGDIVDKVKVAYGIEPNP